MNYEPRAEYRLGAVVYPDVEAVVADARGFLAQRIVCARGERFPPLLQEFDFALELPDGSRFPLRGQIISLRSGTALIQVSAWPDALGIAIDRLTGDAPPAPAARAPVNTARSATSPDPARGAASSPTLRAPVNALRTSTGQQAALREPPPVQRSSTGQQEALRAGSSAGLRIPVGTGRNPAADGAARASRPPPPPADTPEGLVELRAGQNHFQLLGLHFTDPPTRLKPAFDRARAEYGPGSALAKRSPVAAATLLAQVEKAYAELSTRHARDAYRRNVLKVDVVMSAQSSFDGARSARMRGELDKAKDLLDAAIDLDARQDYLNELREVEAARKAARVAAAAPKDPAKK